MELNVSRSARVALSVVTVCVLLSALAAQDQQSQEVPKDLGPLLSAPQSEMRLVVQHYTLDRAALNGNYDGRGGGGRGRGAPADGPPPAAPVSLSPARIRNASERQIARMDFVDCGRNWSIQGR